MTNSNDYFVTFGSDADVFARKIKSEMEKAKGYVDDFIAHVDTVGKGKSGEALRAALAQGVRGGGGGGGGGTGMAPEDLKTAMHAQAQSISELTHELTTTVAAMAAANRAIEDVPKKISTSIQGIKVAVARAVEEATGRGRFENPNTGRLAPNQAPGAVQRGTQQYEILQGLRRYQAQQGGLAVAAARGAQAQTGIKSIGAQALDRANFDRVINAIRAQTRVIASGAPVRLAGGGAGVAGAVPVNVVAAEGRPVQTAVQAAVAPEDQTPAQKAAARKAEREATGLTRTEQSAAARTAADQARKAAPVLTDQEVADRIRRATAIATPGSEGFTERAKGRYTGETSTNFSATELEDMAQAFDSVGIVVKRTTKTTKEQMASLLQEAHQAYQLIYPEGAEALRTKGFNVQSTTKVTDEVAKMLGDLGPRVAERLHANALLEADYQAGGIRQRTTQRVEAVPGAQQLPPGMVKGRMQTGLGNEEEIRAAVESFRPDAEREMARVQEMARSATFQPYVSASSAVESGASPEEQAKAQAARDALRDIQLATTELDRMGQDFLGLRDALGEAQAQVKRTEKLIGNLGPADYRGGVAGETNEATLARDKAMRQELAQAKAEEARITGELRKLGGGGRAGLFTSPEYQQGLIAREGSLTGRGSDTQQQAHAYYLSEQRAGVDSLAAKKEAVAEAKDEVKTAKEAVESSKKRIAALNAEANAGKNIDMDAYQAQVDKLDRATAGLTEWSASLERLKTELKTLNSVMEKTEDGTKVVKRAVEGMGARQALVASRAASASAGGRDISAYRLLRGGTGAAVAGIGSVAGFKALQGAAPVPDLGFNVKRNEYYSKADRLSKAEQDKLNIATNKLAVAQRDYFTLLSSGEATVEQMNDAWKNLEQAANKFANRIAKGFAGFSPTLATLTGVHPLGEGQAYKSDEAPVEGPQYSEKTLKDESRRRAKRDQAEADRTRKIEADPVVKAEEALAANIQRRTRVTEKLAKLEEDLAAQEAALGQGMSGKERAAALDKATQADVEYQQANARLNKLLQQRAMAQDPALSGPPGRPVDLADTAHLPSLEQYTEGAYSDIATREVRGGETYNQAVAKAQKRVAEAYEKRASIVETLAPRSEEVAEAERLEQIALKAEADAAKSLERYEKQVRDLTRTFGMQSGKPFTDPYVTRRVESHPAIRDKEDVFYEQQQKAYDARAAAEAARERAGGTTGGTRTQEQLEALRAQRPGLVRAVTAAREEGDLKENAGYHAAREALGRLDGQIAAFGQGVEDDLVKKLSNTVTEIGQTEREIDRLNTEIDDVNKTLDKATKKATKAKVDGGGAGGGVAATTEATKNLSAAEQARVAVLKAEKAELAKVRPTGVSVKQLEEQAAATQKAASAQKGLATRYATSDPARSATAAEAAKTLQAEATAQKELATAAAEAKQGITAINKELRELGVGGRGAAGGGTRPPTARGGADGGFGRESNNILRDILNAVKAINTTLKGGVKITGRASSSAGGTTAPVVPPTQSAAAKAAGVPALVGPTITAAQRARLLRAAENQQLASEAQDRKRERASRAAQNATDAAARAQARATQQNAAAVRAQLRTDAEMAAITNQVSQATKDEITELERLTQAAKNATTAQQQLAAEQAVVAQQTKVATSLERELSAAGAGAQDRRRAIGTTLRTAGPALGTGELDQIMRTARQPQQGATTGFQNVGRNYGRAMGTGVQSGFAQVFGGGSSFFDRILHTTGTFIVRNFAAGFVFGITNQLQAAIQEAIHTQQTFVRLSSTLQATGKDMGDLRVNLQGISSAYGVSLNDLYDTAAKLAGVFKTSTQLEQGTKTVAMLQMISEGALNAEESVGALTSIWAAFGNTLQNQGGPEHIVDVATALQNLTGVNIENTVEGMARLAGQSKQMSITMEESATFVAQISRETNVTGATAGEQLSRILAQAQGAGGQAALKDALGQDIFTRNTQNGAINYGAILKQLIGEWGSLSKVQQENLTHSLAGTRQAATFNALMDNGTRTLSNLAKATSDVGSGQARMTSLMHTLTGEIARLTANFKSLVKNLLDTGLLNWLGFFIEATNDALGALNKFLAGMNQAASEDPLINLFVKLTGTVIGAGAALIILTKAYKGLRAATSGGGGLLNLASMGMYGGGRQQEVVGGIAGSRLAGAVGGGASAAASGGLAAAMKGETAAILAETGAQARLIAPTGILAKTLTEASAAEAGVSSAAAAYIESTAAYVRATQSATASQAEIVALDRARMEAQVQLTGALSAHAATEAQAAALATAYEAEGAAIATRTEAELAMAALIQGGTATQAALDAAAADVVSADLALVAAIRIRIAAEEAAAGAATFSARENILAKLGPILSRMAPILQGGLVAVVSAYATTKVLMAQVHRVEQASKETGGAAPETGATAGEYRASAKAYRDALTKSNQDESKGLFGLGFGPSLTKAVTKGVPNPFGGGYTGLRSEVYQAADVRQANLKEIDASLKIAAKAMDRISKSAAQGGSQGRGPAFTSFDTDYMTKRMKELDDAGQSAGQEMRELSNALHRTAEEGKKLTAGTFLARGRQTKSLADVAKANTPGLEMILSDQGLPVQGLGERLQQTLRATGAPGARRVNPAKTTQEAIQRMQDEVLAQVEPTAQGSDYASRLGSLVEKYGKDSGQVKAYKDTYKKLQAFFYNDLHSYETLMNEAVLSRKDTLSLIDMINQKEDAALADIPDSALSGKTAVNKRRVSDIEATIARSGHAPTAKMINELQVAQNTLAESQFAEAEAVMKVAQSNTKDKHKIYAAGMKLIRRGVKLAVSKGDARLLSDVIAGGGKVALAIAKQAVQALADAWAAYDRMIADVNQATNAVVAEYSAGAKKPGTSRRSLRQFQQDFKFTVAPSSKDSDFLGPAFADANSSKTDANQLRQDRAALVQARLGVREAYATARGDAVLAARIEVQIAQASIAAARADLAAAKTEDERLQAQASIANAQAQLIAAHAQVAQAQLDLINSQYDVSIALAEAAGRTVQAAVLRAKQANAVLQAALKKSHGKNTAEVNQARAGAVSAEAAVRDARLQDDLDTIDFNLQMGKITQSAAIHALQQILRTHDLTQAQRRQLMLQIKGMKDEMADSQWNIADIKLPTPYQMRRYIEQRRQQFARDLDGAAGTKPPGGDHAPPRKTGDTYHQETHITIDGADIGLIRRTIKEVVGGNVNVRTTGPRRNRN